VLARDIRVLVWGMGEMGSGIVRALSSRKGVVVVGAVCAREEKAGKDVHELAGIDVPAGAVAMCDGNFATQMAKPDVVVVASGSTVDETFTAIETALAYSADVVCIAEEAAYPWRGVPDLAEQIDALAKQAKKTVVGTGVNPGFVLDTLIVALTGAMITVERVYGRRVNDLSCYGPTVLESQGVGLTPEEFEAQVASGDVVGHVGFPESISMIADAVGFRLSEIKETREAIVSTVRRETAHVVVEPGQVAGCRQRALGMIGEHVVIELDHPQQVRPEAEGIETLDEIQIAGDPPIHLTMQPEIAGGTATIALAVNTIPLVMGARPGLVAMTDLPVPRGVAGDMRLWLKTTRARGKLYEVAEPGTAVEGAAGTGAAPSAGGPDDEDDVMDAVTGGQPPEKEAEE
jgi:4-hydroxy-tetrahydrodipicolinate reductase